MNPDNLETQTWASLRARGAAQISAGFAERVLRVAHEKAMAAPSLFSQFALGAATAALCFVAVAIVDARSASRAAAAKNLADWQQIASASEELAQAQ